MAELPLGGYGKDFDSKKARGAVVNLIPEGDKGVYRTVRRCEGLSPYVEVTSDPARSDPLVNAGYIYCVFGDSLFRVDEQRNVENLGTVGGNGRAKLVANSFPNDSQILILNGSGTGYVYQDAPGLVQITDPDFFPSSSVTILDERFWLIRDGTNEFFGSEISSGLNYDPLTFASAEEKPDLAVAAIAKKSALWVLNEESIEYWQSYTDITLPLRKVKGASKEWGILAKDSLAEINDYFAFLANDRSVQMIRGDQLTKISDLSFELKVKGNGTATYPGFKKADDAIGFFVEGPIHSTYYLTFPSEGYTWGYDVSTGLPHERTSEGFNRWRVNGATIFGEKIIGTDARRGVLWLIDPNAVTEDSGIQRTKLVTSSISFDKDVTIPLIELDMEVAKHSDPDLDPKLMVSFSRDGGNNWINHSRISLGGYGQHDVRVPLRLFGKLRKNKDFILRLETTDPVGIQYYGAHIYPREDF